MLCAHTGEILPGILSDLYERVAYSRRSPRDVDWWSWRAVRKTGEGSGEGEGERRPSGRYPSQGEEKKTHRGRTYTFLLFAHTDISARICVWLHVGGRSSCWLVCVCVHVSTCEGEPRTTSRRDVYNVKTRCGIARNNYKHRGVTINLPLSFSIIINELPAGGGTRCAESP